MGRNFKHINYTNSFISLILNSTFKIYKESNYSCKNIILPFRMYKLLQKYKYM